MKTAGTVVCVALLTAFPSVVHPQARPEVMILGSYHMANPGQDAFNLVSDDILADRRQVELDALVEKLAAFRPTKILVESPSTGDSALNARYAAWKAGAAGRSNRSETAQVGFRLAAHLGHAQVYGIDHALPLDMQSAFAFAAQNGQQALLGSIQAPIQQMMQRAAEAIRTQSVSGILAELNGFLATAGPDPYVLLAQIGKDSAYVGARVSAAWYTRNLLIYANMARRIAPGDRVLVIIGLGHVPVLRDLVTRGAQWTLVDPVPLLRR